MVTPKITASAEGTPPPDHAFSNVRIRRATDGRDRRDLQGLNGAKGLIAFGDKGPELAGILLQEIENIAALAEIRALRPYQQCPTCSNSKLP